MKEEQWVLYDKNSERYFKVWTGIGPAGTREKQEAEVFSSKEEAMQSPAYTFGMTFYEPVELASTNQ